ncbi:receptor-like protein kinase At3g21340 isoform X2 [Magnolia sinica]|uniref:receptor-like protein kinase At3g21340 isoform X2 n=2 Tax=Magnolia sinica TaxID=86752 RepID=UPI002659EAFF|nr:receptor-like protein kinase At3g21340 isoform X2 [Magnolia sinica]
MYFFLVNGLESFSYQSMRLYKWTGDPCLPSNSTWEWLSCNDKDPPRVTAIYLSGYNLMGYLQNFSQMEALEIIDLHNNNLRGPIPDFLGEFPNLRVLNLANNNFEGSIPKSILNNDRISFNHSISPSIKEKKRTRSSKRRTSSPSSTQ